MQRMNKVLSGEQYIANFLDEPIRIGTIFRMDDAQFVIALQFDQAFPDIRTTRHRPLFKAFRLRSSWEPEILG